jgi:hypothetical protein
MSGKEPNIKIERITSIFVEGITDVALYRAILRKRFGFSQLTTEEEIDLKDDLLKEAELSILPKEQVRFLKRKEELVIIQGKNEYSGLKEFCEWVKDAIPVISRKIGEYSIDIKAFFIFDNDNGIPAECEGEFPPFLVVTSQQLPERIIFSILDLLFNQTGETKGKGREQIIEIKENFQQIKECFERLKEKNKGWKNLEKREVNLLKSIVGERCHDHLLVELLKLLRKVDSISKIDPLLPPQIISRFDCR